MTQRTTISRNPSTGEVIGQMPEDSRHDVARAVRQAKAAQHIWSRTSFADRTKHVLAIRDYVVHNADRIAEIISRDNGKTRIDALSTEVMAAAMAATYYAKHAERALKRTRIPRGTIALANKRSYIDHVPFGVVGIISPWNYPFAIPFHEIIMALMAGNGVVLKAATQTQQVAGALREAVSAGNLPEGLVAFMNIPGSAAGDALIDAGINKLFFTGSVGVGKELMAKAAARLIPVSLELGGNDAMIVCEDANLYRAAAGAAWAGFSNCGQSCGGVERIYVLEPAYNEFINHLRTLTSSLRQGVDTSFDVDLGSLTTEKQLETVRSHVQDAREKGACITASSAAVPEGPGLFHPAMVIENVRNDMLTMQVETFGPIVAVQKVASIDEAIACANESSLGLTASVWTRDRAKAHRIAARLECGTISINDHLMSHGLAETPWGGFKESGIGRTHGFLGLLEMTQPRCVVDDIMPGVQRNMWWYPHGPGVYAGLRGVLDALYARGLRRRITGALAMMRLFGRTFTRT